MHTAARLALFGVGLVAVFGVAAIGAGALVPSDTVAAWTQSAEEPMMQGHTTSPTAHSVGGLSVEESGYVLDTVTAPAVVGARGVLSFRVLNPDGAPLTDYAVDHEKDLHLIVVRSDGTQFRHVHPTRAADGTWSTPWTWEAAGSYRVYADFRTAHGGESVDVTLTRSVEVPGPYTPAPVASRSSTTVDGYEVAVTGALQAGVASELTISVTKDRSPVTALQPYLGAFGHLVALRVGDLAYLHVHPEGDTPAAGQTAGPEVTFVAEAPTAGTYLLFFDFQVDGQVRTAALTVDAAAAESTGSGAGAGNGADH